MENAQNIDVNQNVTIVKIPSDKIHPNDWNPNKMSDVQFNRLVEDVTNIGFLQPVLVTPEEDGSYRIIDGEHRFEAAKLLDMEDIPCVVVDGDFAQDETRQKFQTMRMNLIRGVIDKSKLQTMVSDLVNTMPIEEIAESMAYDDVDALRSLITDARSGLPPEMRKDFDKAKDEIKTVEDLTAVLNRLFTKYGSTLPFNFMYFDFGGREHIWVRMPAKSLKEFKSFAAFAQENGKTFSSVVLAALRNASTDGFYKTHQAELQEAEVEEEKEDVQTD